jgi:hypothetical protein
MPGKIMNVNDFKDWTNCEKALRQLDHKTLILLSIDWAYSVLPIYEAKYPEDYRPRKAIEAAEQWVDNPNTHSAAIARMNSRLAWDVGLASVTSTINAAVTVTGNAAYAAAWAAGYVAYAAGAAYTARNAFYITATTARTAVYVVNATSISKWKWLYKTYLQAVGPENKTFDNNWLTPTVKSLLYDTSLTPIIADALEDAGCNNNDVLQHLRNNKDWVRADWVLSRLRVMS